MTFWGVYIYTYIYTPRNKFHFKNIYNKFNKLFTISIFFLLDFTSSFLLLDCFFYESFQSKLFRNKLPQVSMTLIFSLQNNNLVWSEIPDWKSSSHLSESIYYLFAFGNSFENSEVNSVWIVFLINNLLPFIGHIRIVP